MTPSPLPENNLALREAVYAGQIFRFSATPESLALVTYARNLLQQAFEDVSNLQHVHQHHPEDHLYRRMMVLRKAMADPALSRRFIGSITRPFDVLSEHTVFDVLRLRWNAPQATWNPNVPQGFIHRDTWYANPACQLNWWLPLFDVTAEESFRFYHRYFDQPIGNTSQGFDYARWTKEIGFQSEKDQVEASHYPTITEWPEDQDVTTVICQAGELVVFSGTHLHQTDHNQGQQTRFSIDFRTVDTRDRFQGLGAPNVDNAAQGDASLVYHPLCGP